MSNLREFPSRNPVQKFRAVHKSASPFMDVPWRRIWNRFSDDPDQARSRWQPPSPARGLSRPDIAPIVRVGADSERDLARRSMASTSYSAS